MSSSETSLVESLYVTGSNMSSGNVFVEINLFDIR